MKLVLSNIEVRVLGCLVEKQATTPDIYPLTLNSLKAACNQKSSRDPVMDLEESTVMTALDTLMGETLASLYQSGRSRTAKYQHKLHHRAFDEFNFSTPELAVLCVLFLRGPQTLGEINSRCARIYSFADLDSVASVLAALEDNEYGPYVKSLPRRAGRKEARYTHLFCGEIDEPDTSEIDGQVIHSPGDAAQQDLQLEVGELKERLATVEQRLEDFIKQFE